MDLRPAASTPEVSPGACLERAVLLTVLYADLFDHPLTAQEIGVWLVGERAPDAEVKTTLAKLEGSHLSRREDLWVWSGREEIVRTRRYREGVSEPRWQQAERFARVLWSVPFVRMVAVCGSQAMDNGDEDGDIDIFCIVEPGRLWLVQCAAMILRRISAGGKSRVCPNYFISSTELEVGRHDLYLAHEITQAVPLRGGEMHRRFLAANAWVRELLPNMKAESRPARLVDEPPSPRRQRWERLLAGRTGDLLDRVVHRLLLAYYPLRLWRRGWSRKQFRQTYRRDRQEVMAEGYAPAVREAFGREAALRLGEDAASEAMPFLFPDTAAAPPTVPDPYFRRLFARHYGAPSASRSSTSHSPRG